LNYYWLECPGCRCEIAVNTSAYPDRISGSLRRWSADRSTNDGRQFELPASAASLSVPCVCGYELALPATPSAVGAEREADLRVKLG
jgi:hypothetical protein